MQLQRDQAQEEEEWYTTQTVSNQEVIQDWKLWKDPIQAEFESLAIPSDKEITVIFDFNC